MFSENNENNIYRIEEEQKTNRIKSTTRLFFIRNMSIRNMGLKLGKN